MTKNSKGEHPLIAVGREGMPVGELIGFKIIEAGDGRAVVTLEAGPQHANPMGTLHGGILCDIADAAMGVAFNSTLASEIADENGRAIAKASSTCLVLRGPDAKGR
jgi:acyl-coenzyme A thioesterase PaaI-like protein